jgi:hypothetical protein
VYIIEHRYQFSINKTIEYRNTYHLWLDGKLNHRVAVKLFRTTAPGRKIEGLRQIGRLSSDNATRRNTGCHNGQRRKCQVLGSWALFLGRSIRPSVQIATFFGELFGTLLGT